MRTIMLNNVVNKLTFEFNCNSELVAKAMSNEITHFWTYQFSEILSKVIAGNLDNNKLWKIERLEIDLGDIRFEEIGSNEIIERFRKLLTENMEERRKNITRTAKTIIPVEDVHIRIVKALMQTGDLPWWMDKNEPFNADKTIRVALENNSRELQYFLRSQLNNADVIRRIKMVCSPETWSVLEKLVPELGSKELNIIGLQEKIHWEKLTESRFNEMNSALTKPFRNSGFKLLLIKDLIANYRNNLLHEITLLNVFAEEELHELEFHLSREFLHEKAEKLLEKLNISQLTSLKNPEFRKKSKSSTLNTASKQQLPRPSKDIKKTAVELIINHPGFLQNNIFGLLVNPPELSGSANIEVSDKQLYFLAFLQRIQKAHSHLLKIIKKLDQKQSAHFRDVVTHRIFPSKASKKTMGQILHKFTVNELHLITKLLHLSKSDLETISEINQVPGHKKTIVENAGLCILAPFLPSFFNHLGYTENGSFKSKAKANRAVYLLQYLVNGKQQNYEYILQFNKLLCGIDIQEPITGYKRLTQNERNEAFDLISSAINHWKALKSTSVKGFQSSFFQRKGILTEIDDHWTLQVEKTSYDLLLDSLPWSFTLIKFPWMKKMIQVEW